MQRLVAIVVLGVALGACVSHHAATSTHATDYLAYDWDDRRVLCSDAIDDMINPVNWSFLDDQLRLAGERGWVLLLHAHTPGVTVSMSSLDHALSTAQTNGLDFVTFRELDPDGEPHAGLALSFDDNAPDQWMDARPILDQYGAKVTFFVSRWQDMTPAQHQEIAILHDDGHDIEPHTVHHVHALDYIAQYDLQTYISNEVLPSFAVLTKAGFPSASAFAYPFGEHDAALDAALLQYVAKVRTTPGECPW